MDLGFHLKPLHLICSLTEAKQLFNPQHGRFFPSFQVHVKTCFYSSQNTDWLAVTLHPWRMSHLWDCLLAQVSPCPSCVCQAAWRQHLSAKWRLRAEGQLGKWHVASAREVRWLECRGGRDCGLSIAVQVPYAQSQPWMAWMVWSKTVNRSFIAASILYYLHQSQTDLVLPQLLWKETLS